MNLTNEYYAKLVDFLRDRLPTLHLIYLFGSYARGDYNLDSDIDLAIGTKEHLDPVKRFELQVELASLAGKPVDLIDLACNSDVLKVQVITEGKVLFSNDETKRAEFEMYALSDYVYLNERRAGIIEDFYKRDHKNGRR